MSESLRSLEQLLDYCGLDKSQANFDTNPSFPLLVTRYYASLIEKSNARDPLLLQVLPLAKERLPVDGYTTDAVGDHQAMPIPGLIHKYRGRVLLTMTGACAIHCRYCFRRHFPYTDAGADLDSGGPVMQYLAAHDDVHEVILSGGDPLMLSDRRLAGLVGRLNQLSQIRTLRIHSRVLSVLPERINEGLLEVLAMFRGKVVFVTHINHPNEISPPNQAVFRLLAQSGYKLFNQSVLLRGVNDDVRVLAGLSHKLFDNHITPYYLHRLDKVQGAAHFDLPPVESERICQQLRGRLPGYLVPLMVDEIRGQASKQPVVID